MKAKWTLGLSMLSLVLGTQLFSLRAEAQVVCGTLAECRTMELQIQATLGRIQARIRELEGSTGSGLGDILRDADGRVRHMSQKEAQLACLILGARLPTARELATYSHGLGACAILSPSEYAGFQNTGNCLKSYYYQVRVAASATEPADEFYFNFSGYQRPAGDLENLWFWSSSVRPVFSYYAYGLNGTNGHVDYIDRNYNERDSAVRCMR
jgi:hypothetical protein